MTAALPFLATLLLSYSYEAVYNADQLPNELPIRWSVGTVDHCHLALEDGVLRVVDEGTAKGELQFISQPWHADPKGRNTVEARVKVLSCSGQAGVIILAADGVHEAGLTLYPDHISIADIGEAPVRLDDDFHTIRLELHDTDLRLLVDGTLLLDRMVAWTKPAYNGRNVIGFGSCSSAATGEALWDQVRYRLEWPEVNVYPDAEHFIVYRQPEIYACFPSCYLMPDGTLMASFGTRVKRSHIDNAGGSARRMSTDGGRTWTKPPPGTPYYDPSLLRADGLLPIASAIGWQYVADTERARLEAEGRTIMNVREGTIAYLSGARSCLRKPGGEMVRDWTPIDVPPGGGMMTYNQSSNLNLGNGVRLTAIYQTGPDKDRSAYVLRSEDDGESWTCLPLALGDAGMDFNETALGRNADGDVIALLRTAESKDEAERGFLYESVSTDRGKTWSAATNTGMWGYPANLLLLPDGRLVATYGVRRMPMGIRACLSADGGRTWDVAHEVVLRADAVGSGSDLGYPVTLRLADGTLLTVYYFNDAENVTHICATRWTPPA